MIKFSRIFAPLLASLLLSAAATAANTNTVTIDFEHFPGADGVLGTADDLASYASSIVPMHEEYAAIGLHFAQGTLFHDGFFDGNPNNHYISSTNPIATLSVPVYGISMDSHSYWNATLTAYDNLGNVLATNTLVNPNAGGGLLNGTVSIASAVPIYSFSILPPNSQQILNLDNLVLTVAAAVPEPEQYVMLALGLMLIAARARRRSR